MNRVERVERFSRVEHREHRDFFGGVGAFPKVSGVAPPRPCVGFDAG